MVGGQPELSSRSAVKRAEPRTGVQQRLAYTWLQPHPEVADAMTHRAFAALLIVGLTMVAGPAFAQQGRDRNDARDNRDSDRVCLYRDIEYQGPSWCYRPGDELGDLRNRSNEISSIRIFGRARVIVYDQEQFMGVSDEFDMDVPDLRLRAIDRKSTRLNSSHSQISYAV